MTDFIIFLYIFQRGGSTTNQVYILMYIYIYIFKNIDSYNRYLFDNIYEYRCAELLMFFRSHWEIHYDRGID